MSDESAPDESAPDESADESAGDSPPDDSVPAETFPPNGETIVVLGLDNSFREEIIEVEAGTEVLWENRGRNDHNVVPVDETAEWGVEVADFTPGDEYSLVFDTPGEYPYYCSIHGTAEVGMTGTVVVTG
jgi:plastocyanin